MAASGRTLVPNLSLDQISALNLTAWLLAPKADAARNSIFAWVPATKVSDSPVSYLADLLLEAASNAAKDMGYTPKRELVITDRSGGGVYLMDGDGTICKNKGQFSTCWIGFALRKPDKQLDAPLFVGTSGTNWFFNPAKNVYSKFVFPKKNYGLNELELLINTSKYLPKWFYFYAAPNKVNLNSKDKLKIPAIINKGKVHYFLKPK